MTKTAENTIERRLTLKAPLQKAWNAIATPEGFAGWFLARVEGEWKEGNAVTLWWPSGSSNEILLQTIEPQTLFAYRWHPGAYKKLGDYPESELTTVTMRLKEIPEGTELLLQETGFENISEERRLSALGMNSDGWDVETESIRKYVEA